MKKLTMMLSSLLLMNGCLLEQDLGKNDQGVNGSGGASGSAGAGASAGMGAGSGSGGSAAGSGSGGAGAAGSGGSGNAGSGGFGAGGSGSGGTGSGGSGSGGTGTGGTGGGTPGYDIVAGGLYFSSVKVNGADVYWTTTGDLSSNNYTYGMLRKQSKSHTYVSGSGGIEGTQAGNIQGAGRTLLFDGNAAYVWFSQIIPGWKGGGATKVTFGKDMGVSFLDAIGPGVATYQPSGDNLIATDATYLYFLCDEFFFDRGICRYPKNPTSGAQFELVVDDPPESISNIGVTSTHVYFTTWSSLERIAIGALPTAQETVGAISDTASSMVVSGSDVYVLGTDSNSALHLTKFAGGAGPGVDLHTAPGTSGSLVVRDGFAYFGNSTAKTISKISTSGGTPSVVVDLSKSKYHPGDFDVDEAHVFVASLADSGEPLADLIHRVPR
ncbi:MAG: hypothetical protein R3B13_07030 [Polyangiaceae bacterium]